MHEQLGPNHHYQHGYLVDDNLTPSDQNVLYTSPRPGQIAMENFEEPGRYAYCDPPVNLYKGFSYPSPGQQHFINETQYQRTSNSDDAGSVGINFRHTRGVGHNTSRQLSSPSKRRKPAKKEFSKRAKLEKPLSELTAKFDHIPIKDTEAWVSRSTEQRRKEVGSDGFVKRPSNSFILYRSAYADRCREYEKSNNHQDISSMAGASWAIEPPHIRKQYENWAKMERENHQVAFPDYKFQPQTQEAKAKKRKERFDADFAEDSDIDDPTYVGGRGATPGSIRSARTKRTRRNVLESDYTPSLGSDGDWGSPEPQLPVMHTASLYETPNAGKPLPTAFTRLGPYGGYYQTIGYPGARFSNMGRVEDVSYHPTGTSMGIYGPAVITGLPGASHEELMEEGALDNGHLTFTTAAMDPDLLAFDQDAPWVSDDQFLKSDPYQAGDYLGDAQVEFGPEDGQVGNSADWGHFEDGNR